MLFRSVLTSGSTRGTNGRKLVVIVVPSESRRFAPPFPTAPYLCLLTLFCFVINFIIIFYIVIGGPPMTLISPCFDATDEGENRKILATSTQSLALRNKEVHYSEKYF